MTHASRDLEESAWAAGVPLVIGCDEAGRGPLAGPVVAAACALPASAAPILGVGDSKTILDESVREELYEKIVSTPGVRWSARIVSAARIDEINIVRGRSGLDRRGGRRVSAQRRLRVLTCCCSRSRPAHASTPCARFDTRSAQLMASLEAMRESIVDVMGQANVGASAEAAPAAGSKANGKAKSDDAANGSGGTAANGSNRAWVLVDGPYSPWKEGAKYVDFQTPALPAGADVSVEPIKKGDAKVYCIAAASIIAKVTRDRAMRLYDSHWPHYDLKTHKGYPTPNHVAAISKHGACAIHRRTFAPLKARALPPPSTEELEAVDAIVANIATGPA